MIKDSPSHQEDSLWNCNPAAWVDRRENRCAAFHALPLADEHAAANQTTMSLLQNS
jgi:hypothetical protein